MHPRRMINLVVGALCAALALCLVCFGPGAELALRWTPGRGSSASASDAGELRTRSGDSPGTETVVVAAKAEDDDDYDDDDDAVDEEEEEVGKEEEGMEEEEDGDEDSGETKDDPAYEILNDTSVLPPSARIVARKIFKDRPLVVWATEWHMTPIKDLKILLSPFGVKFLDYNLDPWRCEWHDCKAKERLKVLTSDNVLNAEPPLAEKFYEAYKDDAEMRSVDVVLCSYPASICEIYVPLNKSVLVLPTTRYDVGRYTADRWNKLNENLRILAQKPWNVFGGNNLYDAKYLQYYTGIETQHLPSVCDYTGAEYTNEINEFLILRRRDRGFNKIFLEQFRKSCDKINCTVKTKMLEGMPHTYKDIASYRGIVHVPYQISVMSIFEQYRMNIPMFFPSSELLARWQVDHYIMHERSFNGAFWRQRPNASVIPPHPSQAGVPDPKNEFDYNSILYWVRFADFYQVMPHSFIYESVDHLVKLLSALDDDTLKKTSSQMRRHNLEFKKEILERWKAILLDYRAASGPS